MANAKQGGSLEPEILVLAWPLTNSEPEGSQLSVQLTGLQFIFL